MGAAYSQDLRDRVLAAADRGMPTKQIAQVFMVSPAWVRRVKQRRSECGETTPRKMGGPGPIKIDRARLAELVREHPDATLAELRDMLDVDCAVSSVSAALIKMGLSYKKDVPRRRAGAARCRPGAGSLEGRLVRHRCRPADLHR
jgi:transposase